MTKPSTISIEIYDETRRERDDKARELAFVRARADELDATVANLKRQLAIAQRRLRQASVVDNSIDVMQREAQRAERANAIRGW